MKSHPCGGNSPSKAKDRRSSDRSSHHPNFNTRKSFSDSFAPSQGCPLACNQGSDSGKYNDQTNAMILFLEIAAL